MVNLKVLELSFKINNIKILKRIEILLTRLTLKQAKYFIKKNKNAKSKSKSKSP